MLLTRVTYELSRSFPVLHNSLDSAHDLPLSDMSDVVRFTNGYLALPDGHVSTNARFSNIVN